MPYQLYIEYTRDRLVSKTWMPSHNLLDFDDLPQLFAYLDIIQDKFVVYHVKKID